MEVGGLKVRENTEEGGEIWEKGDGEERREGSNGRGKRKEKGGKVEMERDRGKERGEAG